MPYKLSASLAAHKSDVRGVASPNNDLVLSASRDSNAISWERQSPNQFTTASIYKASSRYVNAVAYLPPNESSPKGYVVTGGQDTVINIFSLSAPKPDPDFSLLGHTENVCALDVAPNGTIISGSWDRTAKVWKDFQLLYDLKGHQQSVWAVVAADEGKYLTGSADKTIKLWDQHKNIHTYTGHTDAVRGLVLIPDIGFASCSNDSEVRVWTYGGDVIHTLSGHTSFVYSLALLPNGDLVSAGEDRSVRIWKDGEPSQIIVHPAISVWSVSTMPNGDIVSGSSDGVVRVFSTSEERWASEADVKEYEDQVAKQALPSPQVGDVKKTDLPGLEALSEPGKKPGENKMVRNGDIVELHQWDAGASTWQKIGDVVDAVGQGRRQLYQGKEYDYVFDVDIQDGVPPLKLPYNVTENPYSAAQRFLESNDLSLNYIDQVVQFIEKNTGGIKLGGGDDYQDPFTGATRYRSGGSTTSSAPNTQYMDPFTGASRYTGAPPSAQQGTASSYSDPFTGANRYSGTPTAGPASANKVLPVSKSISFKQANVSAMQSKLYQFNDALQNEISTSTLALFPEEVSTLEETFSYLSHATSNSAPAGGLSSNNVEVVIMILDRWPESQLFPVIDLSRLLAGFSPEAFQGSAIKSRFLQALFKASEWNSPWTSPLPKSRETNILLLFRTLANLFQEKTQLDDGAWVAQIIDALGQAPYTILAKSHRVPLATILFNISTVGLREPIPDALRTQLLTVLTGVLQSEVGESEAIYRALVGLGNVVAASKSGGSPIQVSQAFDISQALQTLPSKFPEERIQGVIQEVLALLL